MKYLYFIAGIILAASIALVLPLLSFPGRTDREAEIALVVNDRAITTQELAATERLQPGRDDAESSVDSVITRELLLQEAKRRGLDREEDFRASIKNFYEQSLVKILLDRQSKVFHGSVSDAEVERYLQLSGATIELTMVRAPVSDSPGNQTEDHLVARFADLSEDLRCRVAILELGESTEPIPRGEGVVTYRLDRIDPGNEGGVMPRDLARRLLEDLQERQTLNSWLNELRQKAKIKIFTRHQSSKY